MGEKHGLSLSLSQSLSVGKTVKEDVRKHGTGENMWNHGQAMGSKKIT
jgi:hypothetical protein